MSRTLACLAVVLAGLPTVAQPANGKPLRLALHPAALPRPSLKYRLLPDRAEQQSGNAVTLYYRSAAMLFDDKPLREELGTPTWTAWAAAPLGELPLDTIRVHLERADAVLRELDRAARCRNCDWQLVNRPDQGTVPYDDHFLLLLRQMASVVAVRARYEMARGNFAEAAASLQTGYALAYRAVAATSPSPLWDHFLTGLMVAEMMDAQLETLVQQPGAPNLYWSLTVLPRPFADPERALRLENTLESTNWPDLKRLTDGPLPPKRFQALRRRLNHYRDLVTRRSRSLPALKQIAYNIIAYPRARQALLAQGFTPEQLADLGLVQAVTIWACREYRDAFDERAMWLKVPRFRQKPGYRQATRQLDEADDQLDELVLTGGDGARLRRSPRFSPMFEELCILMDCTERNAARFRCVEAIRLYAAGHAGRLPAALADITEVPVPTDPVTGRPFGYEAKGNRARLTLPLRPRDQPPPPGLATVYELTMQR